MLHPKVLLRISNSSYYGNDYDISSYMIDLRKSVFESDMSKDISLIRQNLQISFVKRLISIISKNSRYDNIAKSSTYYNLDWLQKNINTKSGNLSTKQHKNYLVYLIDNSLDSK